jgi:DNA-binding transcriptional LysR family regulator
MHLDLNLLRVFIAVAEAGSFTDAAARLHATQSTVSQRIARLEQQIERRLLDRTTRSTALTDDGEVLLRYARQIESLAGEIRAEFSDSLLTGEVRLSVPEDFVDAGFADVFARFQRLQPKVKMELRIGLAAEQTTWVEAGDVDLAVVRSTDPDSADGALWSEPILWVASHKLSRELARGDHPTLPLVHVPAPCLYREVAMASLSENAIHWNVVMTCPHLEGIRAAVAAGLGVAAMPECAAPSGVATLGERHGLPSLPMCNLQLRQHDTAERHAAVEALKEVVREYRWRGYGAVV